MLDLDTAAGQAAVALDLAQSIEVGEDEEPVGDLDLLDTMACAGLVFVPAEDGTSGADLVDLLVRELEVGGHGGVDPAALEDLLESAGVGLALGIGASGAYLDAVFGSRLEPEDEEDGGALVR